MPQMESAKGAPSPCSSDAVSLEAVPAVMTPEQMEAWRSCAAGTVEDEMLERSHGVFMGWSRHDWAYASDALIEFFGLRVSVARWRHEIDDMRREAGMWPEFDSGSSTTPSVR